MQAKPPRFRRALGAVGLAVLVGLGSTGCLRVEQTLALKADGSGTLAMRYGMSLADLAEMEAMERSQLAESGETNAPAASPFSFDEALVRQDFESYRALGVTLDDLRTEVVEGWKYLRIKVSFASLAALGQTELIADRRLALHRLPDGRYEFSQSFAEGLEAGPTEGLQELMADMLKGFRAVLRVEVPGSVVSANADQREAQAAVWTFDVDQDAQALERMRKAALSVVFEGAGLNLPDYASPAVEE